MTLDRDVTPCPAVQLLARRLAERTRQVEELTRRAEDAENETAIVRKKHHSSVRVSTRDTTERRVTQLLLSTGQCESVIVDPGLGSQKLG